MSVGTKFSLEFLVRGTPISCQAKRSDSRDAWKARIKRASSLALPDGHFAEGPIAITVYYFPDTAMVADLDSIVKPILDALCKHVYRDDRQVQRILVQKFEPGNVFQFRAPSDTLSQAIEGQKPLLYVRLSNDPSEGSV